MRKMYYRIKYYWHLFTLKKLTIIIRDCIDEKIKNKLDKKIAYHKQAVINYLIKL